VIDVVRERVLDPRLERADDRRLDLLEPVLEVQGGERRLQHRREHVPIARETLDLVGGGAARTLLEPLAEAELSRDDRAARPRHDVGADLRHPPFREVGEAIEEGARDGKLEHRIAEELEPLVGRDAVGGPRRMREDGSGPVLGQRRNQLAQRLRVTGAT
jgi:hypothetical protein